MTDILRLGNVTRTNDLHDRGAKHYLIALWKQALKNVFRVTCTNHDILSEIANGHRHLLIFIRLTAPPFVFIVHVCPPYGHDLET